MFFLLKKFFWIALGIGGALEVDRWVSRQRMRLSPSAMTGIVLDKINQSLESRTRP